MLWFKCQFCVRCERQCAPDCHRCFYWDDWTTRIWVQMNTPARASNRRFQTRVDLNMMEVCIRLEYFALVLPWHFWFSLSTRNLLTVSLHPFIRSETSSSEIGSNPPSLHFPPITSPLPPLPQSPATPLPHMHPPSPHMHHHPFTHSPPQKFSSA